MPLPSLSVVSLPLPPFIRYALLAAGLSFVNDLKGLSEQALAEVSGLSEEHCAEVLQVAQRQVTGWGLAGAVTAADLLHAQQAQGTQSATSSRGKGCNCRISTGSSAMDALLGGGGVACGTVTEFFGVPGVGKTQVSMQLAVNVQIPAAFGGLGGMAICVDTEGSFMTDRLMDMASAAVQHVQQINTAAVLADASRQTAAAQAAQAFTVESILSNILYFRVQHHAEQLALVQVLDLLLQQHQQVALIIIDSITFHFRQDFPDAAQRQRLMTRMAQQLAAVAEKQDVAVVMMNQVVTRITSSGQSSTSSAAADVSTGPSSSTTSSAWLAPALGEGWGQAASCRVALFWEGPQRFALLAKAKHPPLLNRLPKQLQQQYGRQPLCVPYEVTPAGVR